MRTLGKVAVIGAGWAGIAAAINLVELGYHATIFEAAKEGGGRAKAFDATLSDGRKVSLDNGQHILLGAYCETLRLMHTVGLEPADLLLDLPLSLRFPDGQGVKLRNWRVPLDALAAIISARGWSSGDKWQLLSTLRRWQVQKFQCAEHISVAQLCVALSSRVMANLIEPLCVAALNTPTAQASASVFLRVLHDALFGGARSSHLLLPKTNLSALFPDAALVWLRQHGAQVNLNQRVETIDAQGMAWCVNARLFDAVILATSAFNAAALLSRSTTSMPIHLAGQLVRWSQRAKALRFAAIATVYAWGKDATLQEPMQALRPTPDMPAQFVFDRGQLQGRHGLLAFVVSAAQGDRLTLQAQVLAQAQAQLGLSLQAVQTIIEKRATFVCAPALQRPERQIAPGLLACADYVAGPYPATLEGAVRSARATAAQCHLHLCSPKCRYDLD